MKIPDQFGIPKPDFPDSRNLANDLLKALSEMEKATSPKVSSAKTEEVLPAVYAKAIIAMATNIWRIRSRIVDPLTSESKEEVSKDDVKKIARYVEAIYASITSLGIEIKDRTGESFDYGLPEKVVTANPQEGLTKERIIETMRPTIYWNNQIAQQGEVVIATPLPKN
jgi:hypothetical protein